MNPIIQPLSKEEEARITTENADMKIEPLNDMVLVERVKPRDKTRGGILLPDTAHRETQKAVVKAVGPGNMLMSGQPIPMTVQPGDRVLMRRFAGANSETEVEGQDVLLVHEPEIMAIILEDDEET